LLLVVAGLHVSAGCGKFDVADGAAFDADAGEDAKAGANVDADSVFGGADASDAASTTVNFAALGSATATSVHPKDNGGAYLASNAIDGQMGTSWYADYNSCSKTADSGAAFVCANPSTKIDIRLDTLRTIGRVKVFGNRGGYSSGWDVLRLRIELLDDAATVLYTAEKATSRGAEPNGDVDHVITPARPNVRTVRIVVLSAENDDPGLAEIEAYAN
jgi:hypothetical protein